MENLNAEQVKKALECCIKNQCENCCQCGNWHEQWNCMTSLMKNALALINSQEQRIKELAAENERLKAQKYYIHSDGRIEMIPTVESVRADTIDEFVKMVKEKMREVATGKRTSLIGTGWIDEIARVLKGE